MSEDYKIELDQNGLDIKIKKTQKLMKEEKIKGKGGGGTKWDSAVDNVDVLVVSTL